MENKEEIDAEFGYLWAKQAADHVLVKSKSSYFGYSIMNRVYNTTILIEDSDIATYVINTMLKHGALVVDDFETVRNPNKPDPFFLTSEDEEKYRKFQKSMKSKNLNNGKTELAS